MKIPILILSLLLCPVAMADNSCLSPDVKFVVCADKDTNKVDCCKEQSSPKKDCEFECVSTPCKLKTGTVTECNDGTIISQSKAGKITEIGTIPGEFAIEGKEQPESKSTELTLGYNQGIGFEKESEPFLCGWGPWIHPCQQEDCPNVDCEHKSIHYDTNGRAFVSEIEESESMTNTKWSPTPGIQDLYLEDSDEESANDLVNRVNVSEGAVNAVEESDSEKWLKLCDDYTVKVGSGGVSPYGSDVLLAQLYCTRAVLSEMRKDVKK